MTKRPRIYLDHAATTPILPAAKAAMFEAMERWANPSSPHAEGRAARAALEDARERIKKALGWEGELIFTSGATEAIAIALAAVQPGGTRPSAVEHDAVLRHPNNGLIKVDEVGRIHWSAMGHLIYGTSHFVIQHANNETGVIQPLERLKGELMEQGESITLLSDCAQTAGKLPLPPADLIAVSAHKLGGPPGVGALLARNYESLEAGGGQERGYRGGTENLPAILGFAAALEAQPDWLTGASGLRAYLEARLIAAGGMIVSADTARLPNIGAYRMPGVASEAQLIHFDLAGIAVSAGSACASGSMKPSHVLAAMGWEEQAAREVVRVSFGPQTTYDEVEAFADAWEKLAERKRAA